jgi:peptide/nickel transport system substrate-binding protein
MKNRLAAGLLAALALTGCSDKSASGDGGGTVIIALGSDPGSLFPLLVTDEAADAATDLLFGKLADIGPDLASVGDAGFKPRLAKSWDWSRDSLQITFHLDPAARFHDGTPVTGGDVRYSFRLAKDPALGSGFPPLIANIDSVTVPDSLTAKFWYHRRSPSQFFDAVYQIAPVPEHVYGKIPVADIKTSEITRRPVGSGRFRFVKWEPGVRLELVADTANFLGRPKIDRVIFIPGQAPTATAASVLAGEMDFYASFPIDQVDQLDSSSVARPIPYVQNGYGYIGMNQFDRKAKTRPHAILSDANVRRAISMALDRQAMLTNVFKTSGRLAYGPFPTGVVLSDSTVATPPYDTAKAGALLDAAGWRRGPDGVRLKNGRPLALELMVPTTSLIRMRYADLIQEQLNRAGIRMEIAKAAGPEFAARQDARDYDMAMITVNVDASVAGIQQYWSSGAIRSGFNYLLYRNRVVDASLDSAAVALDPAVMRRNVSRAFKQIVDDVPAVWLYTASTVSAANRRIEIPSLPRDGWWGDIPEWSIPPDKRIARDRVGLRPASTP